MISQLLLTRNFSILIWEIPWTEEPGGLQSSAAAAKSLQLCLTLCDPIDGSPPGSPVPGILQARTREWVAIWLEHCTLTVKGPGLIHRLRNKTHMPYSAEKKKDKNVIKLYFYIKLSLFHNKHCTLNINKNFVFYWFNSMK